MPLADPAEMPQEFARAWAARDAAALAALFAEDADFVNVVGLWWRDRGAIERAHRYGLTTFFRDSVLRVGRVAVRDLGAVAVVHARMHLSGQIGPDGRAAGPRSTILSFVLHRSGPGWTCVSAQNTDVVPGAETHVAEGGTLRPRDYRASDRDGDTGPPP
ncbi:SgcJ/EcaC family oxidoreductase [Rhodobacteraceae bacterium CCMM004]|nr:SgcJ/EcaC family oxidoreductase [Rhodobacteraceae bacterium CCMM004]